MTKIVTSLNEYAIDKLYDIIEKYGSKLSDDQLEMLNDLITSNHIIIVHWLNDTVKEHFNGESIPPASGPRSWEDGKIHIYPFFYANIDTDEVIEKYINEGIITHELFHYLITLDTLNNNPNYDKYYSYLNEGFVQFLTEQTEDKLFPNVNYRRNVEFVKKLLGKLNNNIKSIIRKRLTDDELNIINEMYNDYSNEQKFMNDLNEYLKTVSERVNIPHDKLVNYYDRKSIDGIIEDMYKQLLKTNDDELKRNFDEIVSKFESNLYKKAY